MRISDWSSDVCSSDLVQTSAADPREREGIRRTGVLGKHSYKARQPSKVPARWPLPGRPPPAGIERTIRANGRHMPAMDIRHCTEADLDRKSTRLNSSH